MSEEEIAPQDGSPDEASQEASSEAAPEGSAEPQSQPEAEAPTEETPDAGPQALSFEEFSGDAENEDPSGLDLISDVQLDVSIELGRTRMLVEDVLRLSQGAVVELDKLAGDPVDVYVNERLIARGEVLVMNDNFSIRVNEILDIAAIEDVQRSQRPAG